MRDPLRQREVRFFVQDGCLVRTVSGNGRAYTHRCDLQAYETVAHAVSETPAEGTGTSLNDLARQEALAYTRVNVALQFLKERGIVEVRHRRCYPDSTDVCLDAMIEFYALSARPLPDRSHAFAPSLTPAALAGVFSVIPSQYSPALARSRHVSLDAPAMEPAPWNTSSPS